jgi:hypothetical protein
LIQILAISGTLTALQTNHSSVYLAIGRPKIVTALTGLQAMVLFPLLIWGAMTSGAKGAAVATLIASAVQTPIAFTTVLTTIRLPLANVISVLWRPALATAAMALAVITVLPYTPKPNIALNQFLRVLLAACTGAAVYVVVMGALWKMANSPPGIERFFLDRWSTFFSRLCLRRR